MFELCGEAGLKPFEVMMCTVPEILCYLEGYYRRLSHSYRQTRILAYSVYALTADKPEDQEDWWPLWFDDPPEERRAKREVEVIKRGMVAEKDIEHYRSLGIDI